mgnify:CR=1 FL=1
MKRDIDAGKDRYAWTLEQFLKGKDELSSLISVGM